LIVGPPLSFVADTFLLPFGLVKQTTG